MIDFLRIVGSLTVVLVFAIVFAIAAGSSDLRRDLRLHMRATRCLIRRRHYELREIGTIGKTGFRGMPIRQCTYCTMIVAQIEDAKRFGGKQVS